MSLLTRILNAKHRKMLLDAILTPCSWVYGGVVWVRNFLFERGWIKRHSFKVPVVSVGNITVGGTGKTPMVEYIIEALYSRYNIEVLSRGYKRMTSGFILATDSLSPRDIGDEPFQIFHKFNGLIKLAVCEDRVEGINRLLELHPDINLILLDDAFQHRQVKPKVNVVLVDYTRLPYEDKLLPLGNLREPMHYLTLQSDIVVVTKCPPDILPRDMRLVKEHLDLFPDTSLYYSTIRYGAPRPIFPVPDVRINSLQDLRPGDAVLCLTGIANHRPFAKYLMSFGAATRVIHFDDHHYYSRADFELIFSELDKLPGERKFVITTEKDAVKILNNAYYPPERRSLIYFVPIKVGLMEQDGPRFIDNLVRRIESHNDDPTHVD